MNLLLRRNPFIVQYSIHQQSANLQIYRINLKLQTSNLKRQISNFKLLPSSPE